MRLFARKTAENPIKDAAGYVAVFLTSLAVSAVVQWFPMFRDPDSFYHLKMALLMREQGIVFDFPWLPFTTLAEHYADHHFLYHVLLVPFVSIFGSTYGMIIATAVLAATAITLFYALLRTYGVRDAGAYVFILGTAAAFLFRIELAKASALSLSILFLALIAIRKERVLGLFLLAWLYVLSYGGWPILAVVVGAFVVSRVILDRLMDAHPWRSWASRFFWTRLIGWRRLAWRQFSAAPETRLSFAALGGLACGLVVNPYFPNNIRFYWEQIVQIAVIGRRDGVGVGSEWYPYSIGRLLGESGGAFLLWMIVLAVFAFMMFWPEVVKRGKGRIGREELSPIVASVALMMLFFFLTLRSKRHVEYLLPFTVFSAALSMQALRTRLDLRMAHERLSSLFPRAVHVLPVVFSWFVAVFLYVGIKDIALTRNLYAQGIPWTKYERAAAWIAARAPAGSTVMHSDWDDFPMLFYRDSGRSYIAGLDPTFLYRQDPERYRLWVDITTGKVAQPVVVTRDRFRARYVLIEKDHRAMMATFDADPRAIRAYEDDDVVVFSLL